MAGRAWERRIQVKIFPGIEKKCYFFVVTTDQLVVLVLPEASQVQSSVGGEGGRGVLNYP